MKETAISSSKDLWHYCTEDHVRTMLLSFRLLGENDWPEEKILACLYSLSNHTQDHYKRIQIQKKSGGTRTLLAPDPLLKYVQRNLLHHVLDGLSLADCATAYRKNRDDLYKRGGQEDRDGSAYKECFGIVPNARIHVGKPLVMKLDIVDFFGNITFPMVLHQVFPARMFPPAVGNLLTSLCCCGEYLPQGAPTSPAVSNRVMKPFDEFMEAWCRERGISYSRYSDDLTFSGDFSPKEVRGKVKGFLGAYGFELNRKKTRILSLGTRQKVTGLVVNEKAQTSKEYRRKLRQEIYYCRRFGVKEHLQFQNKGEPACEADQERYLYRLLGKVNYVRMTRPEDKWFLEARQWLKGML